MFTFRKTVPVDGYQWREDLVVDTVMNQSGGDAKGPFLVGCGNRGRVTNPLEEEPTLFEAFALLRKGPDAGLAARILRFAGKHGDLGVRLALHRPITEGSTPLEQGEDLGRWKSEIEDMAVAFRVWRCVQERNATRLARSVKTEGTALTLFWEENFESRSQEELLGKVKMQMLQAMEVTFLPGDLFGPANYLLQHLINEKITGHVSPRVLRDPEFNLVADFVPDSLLSAMWFQFFKAVTGLSEFIQCGICGELIVKKQGSRNTKAFHTQCSKYRSDRKHKARELHRSGVSVAEIAKQVGEDASLVAEWVAD